MTGRDRRADGRAAHAHADIPTGSGRRANRPETPRARIGPLLRCPPTHPARGREGAAAAVGRALAGSPHRPAGLEVGGHGAWVSERAAAMLRNRFARPGPPRLPRNTGRLRPSPRPVAGIGVRPSRGRVPPRAPADRPAACRATRHPLARADGRPRPRTVRSCSRLDSGSPRGRAGRTAGNAPGGPLAARSALNRPSGRIRANRASWTQCHVDARPAGATRTSRGRGTGEVPRHDARAPVARSLGRDPPSSASTAMSGYWWQEAAGCASDPSRSCRTRWHPAVGRSIPA